MSFDLIHGEGFVTINFSRVRSLAPCPIPNLEDQGLHFVWPLPFNCLAWVALPGAYSPASIAVWVIQVCKRLHAKAVALEDIIHVHELNETSGKISSMVCVSFRTYCVI
jgi:hypothetical protein